MHRGFEMKIAQQDTAIAQYHGGVRVFAGSQKARVLDHITRKGPSTIGEIAAALKLAPGTVSGRAYELREIDGLIEWAPERESIVSGVTCKTLRLPVRQMELC